MPRPHRACVCVRVRVCVCVCVQALYGIIQGGVYRDLRERSTAFVNDHDFFGIAIGGSLGADKRMM